MQNNLDFIQTYGANLQLREQRATLLAQNIANATTPGYAAKDIPFHQALSAAIASESNQKENGFMARDEESPVMYRTGNSVGLDGNDVSMNQERVEMTDNAVHMAAATDFLKINTSDLILALRPNPSGD